MGHGERSVKLKDKKYLANQKVLFEIYKKNIKKVLCGTYSNLLAMLEGV